MTVNDLVNKRFSDYDNSVKHDDKIRKNFLITFPRLIASETIQLIQRLDCRFNDISKIVNGVLTIEIYPHTNINDPLHDYTCEWNCILVDELNEFVDNMYNEILGCQIVQDLNSLVSLEIKEELQKDIKYENMEVKIKTRENAINKRITDVFLTINITKEVEYI